MPISPLHQSMVDLENVAPPGALQEFRDAIVAVESMAAEINVLVARVNARLPDLEAVRKQPGKPLGWSGNHTAVCIAELVVDQFDLTPEACAVLSAALMKGGE